MLIIVVIYLFYSVAKPIVTVSCSSPTTVVEGDNFTCECKGTNGNPPADVTWYKDSTQIGDTGKEKAILPLSNVSRGDNGTYTCEAKSLDETNETAVALIVACKYDGYSSYVTVIKYSNIFFRYCSALQMFFNHKSSCEDSIAMYMK